MYEYEYEYENGNDCAFPRKLPTVHSPLFPHWSLIRLAGRSYPFIAQRYTLYVHEKTGELRLNRVRERERERLCVPKKTAYCPLSTFSPLARLAGRSYTFTAQRYTLYVHENVNAKVKSCTSTRTRTIVRSQENCPLPANH